MAYQVDWEAGVITIPKTDLTFLSGTSYELDLRAFKFECWRLTWEEGLSYPEMLTYYPAIPTINQSESVLINYDYYMVEFEVGNYLVNLFGAASDIDLYVIMNGVSIRMSGGVAVTINSGGSSLTTEEHTRLMSLTTYEEDLDTEIGCSQQVGEPVTYLGEPVTYLGEPVTYTGD